MSLLYASEHKCHQWNEHISFERKYNHVFCYFLRIILEGVEGIASGKMVYIGLTELNLTFQPLSAYTCGLASLAWGNNSKCHFLLFGVKLLRKIKLIVFHLSI